MEDRHHPASTTVPQAPQTRSSLSFPIGNSKERRVLKSIIDAAGWGLPTVRSLAAFASRRRAFGKSDTKLRNLGHVCRVP
jgi:hypothetical protein